MCLSGLDGSPLASTIRASASVGERRRASASAGPGVSQPAPLVRWQRVVTYSCVCEGEWRLWITSPTETEPPAAFIWLWPALPWTDSQKRTAAGPRDSVARRRWLAVAPRPWLDRLMHSPPHGPGKAFRSLALSSHRCCSALLCCAVLSALSCFTPVRRATLSDTELPGCYLPSTGASTAVPEAPAQARMH